MFAFVLCCFLSTKWQHENGYISTGTASQVAPSKHPNILAGILNSVPWLPVHHLAETLTHIMPIHNEGCEPPALLFLSLCCGWRQRPRRNKARWTHLTPKSTDSISRQETSSHHCTQVHTILFAPRILPSPTIEQPPAVTPIVPAAKALYTQWQIQRMRKEMRRGGWVGCWELLFSVNTQK